MADPLYGISERDRPSYRELIEWWSTFRQSQDNAILPLEPVVPFVCLQRPDGWNLGQCRRLIRDSAWPFVWEIILVGYPAIAGITTFAVRWTHEDKTTADSGLVKVDATPTEFAAAQPDVGRYIVRGGSMRANEYDKSGPEYSIGRWWLSFAAEPDWTPEVIGLGTDRLIGIVRRNHLRPSEDSRPFFSLASTDGPTPIHPGTVAIGFPMGGQLMMALHEPRVFQGTLVPIPGAVLEWAIFPYLSEVVEGNTAEIQIRLVVTSPDELQTETTTSVDVEFVHGETVDADFVDTLNDWLTTATSGSSVFSWDGARLTANVSPGTSAKAIEHTLVISVGTTDEGTVEGQETATISISNPLASEASAVVSQATGQIVIRDANSIQWDVTGPATANPGDTKTYTIAASGILETGLSTSVTLARTGTVSPADTTDWESALLAAISDRDEVTYSRSTGTLEIIATEDGVVAAISFDVGYESGAEGEWILTASNAQASVGVDVEIGSGSVTTLIIRDDDEDSGGGGGGSGGGGPGSGGEDPPGP